MCSVDEVWSFRGTGKLVFEECGGMDLELDGEPAAYVIAEGIAWGEHERQFRGDIGPFRIEIRVERDSA